MTAATSSTGALRGHALTPIIIWLFACAFMMFISARALAAGAFPDPDDIMRLIQVRDWLAGQSWFDLTQYRLNGDFGVVMHWSRLVDVPIGAVILAARPFVGAARAETVALVLVPLLTLGITMFLVHRIALNLMTSRAALAAVAATPLSLGAMKQLRPMRIDHHGWQIVMALAALLACFDERARRSGMIAGLAMAVWLNISLEGLPFAVSIGALFAWQWLRDASAVERLQSFLASLAILSFVIFAATHLPATWMSQQHDVVTMAYLAGFAAAALCIAGITRVDLPDWRKRLFALGAAGAVTLCAMLLVDPHWMVGPFSSMGPLVRTFWYEGVDEGLPMWKVHWSEGAMGLSQPIVGLIGGWAALARSEGRTKERWAIYLFLLLSTAISSLSVIRISTTASVIAMPGTAFLCQLAFRRARAQQIEAARVFSTTAALLLMAPAYALPISFSSPNPRLDKAVAAGMECQKTAQVMTLRALGRSEIVAPFDVTPSILLHTSVRALATGHHRNAAGMRDTIRIFLGQPATSKALIRSRRIDFVVICPGAPESLRYVRYGPNGLAAQLIANRPPDWLQETQVPGLTTFKVWRVRKDLLA